MAREISISLSVDSINDAIHELNEYKDEIEYKTVLFIQKMADIGLNIISERIANIEGDSDTEDLNPFVEFTSTISGTEVATLVLHGKDVAFIEFGAGVHFNTAAGSSPSAFGQELGYTIGSYGLGHGKNDYWFYTDGNGDSIMSYGTKAALPLTEADKAIKDNFMQVAKEVFG